jgi:hypothetical protein
MDDFVFTEGEAEIYSVPISSPVLRSENQVAADYALC